MPAREDPAPAPAKARPPVLEILTPLAARLAQRAAETDQSRLVPREHLEWLAEAGYFRLGLPEPHGISAPAAIRRTCREMLAAACGVTTFVAAQHVSACGAIAASPQADGLEEFLGGRRLAGICFAHLRRPGAPCVTATPDGDGWVFDGVAPWFTGWGLMDEVALAGTLPDGRFLFALVPLDSPGLTAGKPMELCAMNASGTVALHLQGVPARRLLKIATEEDLARDTRLAMVRNASPSLGVVRAVAVLLGDDLFAEEVDLLRAWMDHWDPEAATDAEIAQFRAEATFLGIRAAHALVVAAGGEANRLDHPAQRLAREAMFYSLTQLTPELKRATVGLLVAG